MDKLMMSVHVDRDIIKRMMSGHKLSSDHVVLRKDMFGILQHGKLF